MDMARIEEVLNSGDMLEEIHIDYLISERGKAVKSSATWQGKYAKLQTEHTKLKEEHAELRHRMDGLEK